MFKLFSTQIGRLRLAACCEGISLLILLFIAVPLKYAYARPNLVKTIGPIHGSLFLLFMFLSLSVGVEQRWEFKKTTWKILLACFIPFGTFYIDHTILSKMKDQKSK